MTDLKKKFFGSALAFFAAVFFGAYPIIARFIQDEQVSNQTVLFLRFFLCVLFLTLYNFIFMRHEKAEKKIVVRLLLIGGCVYSLMSFFNLEGISRISVSLASLILCLYPLFVVIISILLKREAMTIQKAGALLISIIGVYLLLNVTIDTIDLAGLLASFAASIMYTAYILLGSETISYINPVKGAYYIMMGACIAFGLTGFVSGGISITLTAKAWGYMGIMAIASTAVPVIIFWKGVSMIGPSKTSIIGSAEPLSTVLLAAVIFHENISFTQVIGTICVLIGVAVVQIPDKYERIGVSK